MFKVKATKQRANKENILNFQQDGMALDKGSRVAKLYSQWEQGLQMVRVTRKSRASAGCDEPRLKSTSSQVPGFGNVIYSTEDTDPGPMF